MPSFPPPPSTTSGNFSEKWIDPYDIFPKSTYQPNEVRSEVFFIVDQGYYVTRQDGVSYIFNAKHSPREINYERLSRLQVKGIAEDFMTVIKCICSYAHSDQQLDIGEKHFLSIVFGKPSLEALETMYAITNQRPTTTFQNPAMGKVFHYLTFDKNKSTPVW